MELEVLKKKLYECYSEELCYKKVRANWRADNKSYGMCAITSLVVNDYFGGDICKIHVDDISHYFNLIDGKIVDLTGEQFKKKIDYSNYEVKNRDEIMNEDTARRYNLLKERVVSLLLDEVDKQIHKCRNCDSLVEKFPVAQTVFVGHTNDILLIGEAPANNGWRKSGMLWRDINGKMLPSGVVLQKLFDIIDRKVLETSFLEAVKCFPTDRKNLKVCSNNCKDIMLKQLEILKPKLVITLGEFPTRNLLDFKFKKFGDVVGQMYDVGKYKIIPIYHPSPISPKSYSGNIEIFESLKKYLND